MFWHKGHSKGPGALVHINQIYQRLELLLGLTSLSIAPTPGRREASRFKEGRRRPSAERLTLREIRTLCRNKREAESNCADRSYGNSCVLALVFLVTRELG